MAIQFNSQGNIPVTTQDKLAQYVQGMWSGALNLGYPRNATLQTTTPNNEIAYPANGSSGDPRSGGAFFRLNVPSSLFAPSYTGGSNIVTQAASSPFTWLIVGGMVFIGLILLFKR